jgi:hypothetical protein
MEPVVLVIVPIIKFGMAQAANAKLDFTHILQHQIVS